MTSPIVVAGAPAGTGFPGGQGPSLKMITAITMAMITMAKTAPTPTRVSRGLGCCCDMILRR